MNESTDPKQIGETVIVGGFEITVESFEVIDSTNDRYGLGYYVATDGYVLLAANMTVKNFADTKKTFMSIAPEVVPFFNGVKMDVKTIYLTAAIYQGSTAYYRVDGSRDLTNMSLESLESKSGFLVFSIPGDSLGSDNRLIFRITRDEAVFDYSITT